MSVTSLKCGVPDLERSQSRVFLGGGCLPFNFQLLDKPWSHVSSLLRFIVIAQTVQHSRLLVDFHRVWPTNPLKQEHVPSLVEIFHLLTTYTNNNCSESVLLRSHFCRAVIF